jgi:hypothetical protein
MKAVIVQSREGVLMNKRLSVRLNSSMIVVALALTFASCSQPATEAPPTEASQKTPQAKTRAAAKQIAAFRDILKGNNRPVQPLNSRTIVTERVTERVAQL